MSSVSAHSCGTIIVIIFIVCVVVCMHCMTFVVPMLLLLPQNSRLLLHLSSNQKQAGHFSSPLQRTATFAHSPRPTQLHAGPPSAFCSPTLEALDCDLPEVHMPRVSRHSFEFPAPVSNFSNSPPPLQRRMTLAAAPQSSSPAHRNIVIAYMPAHSTSSTSSQENTWAPMVRSATLM